jgi:hypothetical protein
MMAMLGTAILLCWGNQESDRSIRFAAERSTESDRHFRLMGRDEGHRPAVVCWALAHVLDAFTFGEEVAASLGMPVGAIRAGLMTLTALVAAALVSVAGAIGFVGLVLPHAARFLVGPAHGRLVVALHDLNLAALFCDHLMVLCAGRVVAAGAARDVLTPELIADVYQVRAEVIDDASGRLTVRFDPEPRRDAFVGPSGSEQS